MVKKVAEAFNAPYSMDAIDLLDSVKDNDWSPDNVVRIMQYQALHGMGGMAHGPNEGIGAWQMGNDGSITRPMEDTADSHPPLGGSSSGGYIRMTTGYRDGQLAARTLATGGVSTTRTEETDHSRVSLLLLYKHPQESGFLRSGPGVRIPLVSPEGHPPPRRLARPSDAFCWRRRRKWSSSSSSCASETRIQMMMVAYSSYP